MQVSSLNDPEKKIPVEPPELLQGESDGKIYKQLKHSNEDIIMAFQYLANNHDFANDHMKLTAKVFRHINESFKADKLQKEQYNLILDTIAQERKFCSPFLSSLAPDMRLEIEDESSRSQVVQFNKLTLCSGSGYFRAQLNFGGVTDSTQIEGASPASLEIIEHYLRRGEVDPKIQDLTFATEVLNLANQLEITPILTNFTELCTLTPDNASELYELAKEFKLEKLKHDIDTFFLRTLLETTQTLCRNARLEKNSVGSDSAYTNEEELLGRIRPGIENIEGPFSEEYLLQFKSDELLVLFRQFPEKIQALDLSYLKYDYSPKYSDELGEIETIVSQLPNSIKKINIYTQDVDLLKILIERCPNLESLAGILLMKEASALVSELKHLRELDFDLSEFSSLADISKMISNNSMLESLKIQRFGGRNVSGEDEKFMTLLGECCPGLRTLSIKGMYVSEKALQNLFLSPHNVHLSLTSLGLNIDRLGHFAVEGIGHRFPNLTSLEFEFSKNDFNLGQALEKLPGLLSLSLKSKDPRVWVTDDQVTQVAALCPNLKTFTTYSPLIHDSSLQALATHCPHLEVLDLGGADITLEGLKFLIGNKNIKLKTLNLEYCSKLDDEGLLLISKTQPSLQHLRIDGTNFSDEAIAISLLAWPHLRTFVAFESNVRRMTLEAIERSCHDLTRLGLSKASIKDPQDEEILASIESNSRNLELGFYPREASRVWVQY